MPKRLSLRTIPLTSLPSCKFAAFPVQFTLFDQYLLHNPYSSYIQMPFHSIYLPTTITSPQVRIPRDSPSCSQPRRLRGPSHPCQWWEAGCDRYFVRLRPEPGHAVRGALCPRVQEEHSSTDGGPAGLCRLHLPNNRSRPRWYVAPHRRQELRFGIACLYVQSSVATKSPTPRNQYKHQNQHSAGMA